MRYDEQDRESKNIEDRRGQGGGGMFGGSEVPMGGGRGGFSLTTMLLIGAVMLFFGLNPLDLLKGGLPNMGQVPQMPRMDPGKTAGSTRQPFEIPGLPGGGQGTAEASNDEMKKFVGRVLADTEDVWSRVFQGFGKRYKEPKLVIFDRSTRTACGPGQTAMGPFYCPVDQVVYIDLAFYDELKNRFKAPGDFAQAYVVAHEVGHHVQTILGIADRVQQMKEQVGDQRRANQIQVRMELQADCLAGVWASLNDQLKKRLLPGDIEEGLNAAAQIGDDMIQRKTMGRIVPDAFTHGTSAQRMKWFKQGFATGRIDQCDTFNSRDLG
jgi:uncharacterized protein